MRIASLIIRNDLHLNALVVYVYGSEDVADY